VPARTGYDVLGYGEIAHGARMEAYAEALRKAVTPGCRVIDIGAGPGFFALLACKYGAGSVVAIEPNDSIHLLARLAEANGCEDRITIFQGLSTDYRDDRKADVIVSDLRGNLPVFEGLIPATIDARERLLAPGGILIPRQDTLRIAVVDAPDEYRRFDEPWGSNPFGLDLSAGRRFAVNTPRKVQLRDEGLLGPARDLAALDYTTIESPDVEGSFELPMEKAGTAHGLLLWFDAEISDGIGFSNAPDAPALVYGQRLFPFERPVSVAADDRVEGRIEARYVGGDYVWVWESRFLRGKESLAAFRQSTFLARVLAPDMLASRTEQGQAR
jgi:type I protein arginine methyltransferase